MACDWLSNAKIPNSVHYQQKLNLTQLLIHFLSLGLFKLLTHFFVPRISYMYNNHSQHQEYCQ